MHPAVWSSTTVCGDTVLSLWTKKVRRQQCAYYAPRNPRGGNLGLARAALQVQLVRLQCTFFDWTRRVLDIL